VLEKGYKNNPEEYGIILANGIFLIEGGRLDEGIGFLEKAVALVDYEPDAWTQLGIAYSKKGEIQIALNHFEKALSLAKTDPLIHNNLGLLYLSIFRQSNKRRDLTCAVESFKKVIELDPGLVSAYNGLGVAYRLGGQIDEAITWWNKALERNPDYDPPIYNLSLAHFDKGNKIQALKFFEKYLLLKGPFLSPEERRKIMSFIRKCKE
jgi:tetratricopeptide (TPR) repeat protein